MLRVCRRKHFLHVKSRNKNLAWGRLTVLSGWPLRPAPRRSSGRTTEQLTACLWGNQRWPFKCSICLYCKTGGYAHPDSRVTGQFRVICYFLSSLGAISFCLIMLQAPLPIIISASLPFCPVASDWEHGPLESPELRPFCVKETPHSINDLLIFLEECHWPSSGKHLECGSLSLYVGLSTWSVILGV